LTITPGESFFGDTATLPKTSRARIASMADVDAAASTYAVDGATVRRNSLVDPEETSGISVLASDVNLPATLGAPILSGHDLNAATARFPTVVLGRIAAQRLGISSAAGSPQVW